MRGLDPLGKATRYAYKQSENWAELFLLKGLICAQYY
jgi:hypothetical protein